MTRHAPAVELLPIPETGRRYTTARKVRLGDVDAEGMLRLDAIARYLQDVATDDADECGLDGRYGWVVRRTMIDVAQPASYREPLELTTFCTGSGRSWAERRTSITGARGAAIETVALWVQVDPATGRPAGLASNFHDIYGEAAAGRQVSTRLRLDAPTEGLERRPWMVRRVDLDPFHHVNNAVHWAVLEELRAGSRVGVAETEFLVPVDLETPMEVAIDGPSAWLVAGPKVHSAFRWTAAP
ncbi:MAG: acyl-[acyl-carrier-protein] thioesterase [Ilumatobacteraceae bacterium]